MSSIYRKTALEKLSSPEQLDKMIRITPPMFWIAAIGGGLIVVAGLIWSIFTRLPINVSAQGIMIGKGGIGTVYSTEEGIVEEVLVKEGDTVEKDQVIATVSDAKIRSTLSGHVVELMVAEGGVAEAGTPVCQVSRTAAAGDNTILCYVPAAEGRKIEKGMKAEVYPSTVNMQEYGHMNAVVSSVDEYVASQEGIQNVLADPALVQTFTGAGPVVCVVCDLEKDPSTVSGYQWSSNKGAEVMVDPGTIVSVDIITDEKAPITMIIPLLKEKLFVQRGNE